MSGSNWTKAWVVTSLVMFLVLITVLIWAGVSSFPKATINVEAKTRSAVLRLSAGGEVTWKLPGGIYTGNDYDFTSNSECTTTRVENSAVVEQDLNKIVDSCHSVSLLRLTGAMRVTLTLTRTGLFIEAEPETENANAGMFVLLQGADRELESDGSYLTFQSNGALPEVYLPAILNHVTLGSPIQEPGTQLRSGGDTTQPVLLNGSVRVFASNFKNERFQALQEDLYVGDVLSVGNDESDVVWGLFIVSAQGSADGDEGSRGLNVSLQYQGDGDNTKATISRFGSVKSHEVRASKPLLMSKDPRFVQAWAFILASVSIATMFMIASEHYVLASIRKSGEGAGSRRVDDATDSDEPVVFQEAGRKGADAPVQPKKLVVSSEHQTAKSVEEDGHDKK